jgi:hypothetical protein
MPMNCVDDVVIENNETWIEGLVKKPVSCYTLLSCSLARSPFSRSLVSLFLQKTRERNRQTCRQADRQRERERKQKMIPYT